MNASVLLAALGLALILEGLMPLIAPKGWRRVVAQLMQLKDGQLRFYGLISVVLGLLLLFSFL